MQKLSKIMQSGYYNDLVFNCIHRNFVLQTCKNDFITPSPSLYGILYGNNYFCSNEQLSDKCQLNKGTVIIDFTKENAFGAVFYILFSSFAPESYTQHAVLGTVYEGFDTLERINASTVDDYGKPFENIRIEHINVLEDPFPDLPGLSEHVPDAFMKYCLKHTKCTKDKVQIQERSKTFTDHCTESLQYDANNKAIMLEMLGDLPTAEVTPPRKVLFICKLNPVTREDDLEMIFSQCGRVVTCEIVREYKTAESLGYGFIGFDSDDACEKAYFKMNNVVIDDRRIKVDFCQSVSHIWKKIRR